MDYWMNLGVKCGSKFTIEEEGKSRWAPPMWQARSANADECAVSPRNRRAIGTTNEDNSYLLLALGSDDPSWLT